MRSWKSVCWWRRTYGKNDDVGGIGTGEFASKAIDTFHMSRK